MKKLFSLSLKNLLSVILLLLSINLFGQLNSYYVFYERNQAYAPLDSATASELFQGVDADNEYQNINLGFDFDYDGTTYSQIGISVNGAITFNTTGVSQNNDLSDTGANIVAPLWDDLVKRVAENGKIWYQLAGTAPYRTCTIDWQNMGISGVQNVGTVSFQLILEETTNNITCIYGNNSLSASTAASIGINASNNSGNFISITPGNPAVSSTSTADNTIDITTNYPGQNTAYSFKHLTYIPDANFEHYLETHDANGTYVSIGASNSMGNGTDNDDYVTTTHISGVTDLLIYDQQISDLTGIADFVALTDLNCYKNNLTNLDISQNTALQVLHCENNQLTVLDVSQNTALQVLQCENNQLTVLDVSQNTALQTLGCGFNQLTALDITQNIMLINLFCADNHLSSLDVSHNTLLEFIFCPDNQLTSLDLSQNTALTYLYCFNNNLNSLNVSQCSALEVLYCNLNNLSNLDVTHNAALEYLFCNNNNLSNLDVSQNTVLHTLICGENTLSNLDVTHNPAIYTLSCQNNNINGLDITQNPGLQQLNCSYNSITSLDCSQNRYLNELYVSHNQLTGLNLDNNPEIYTLHCDYNQLTEMHLQNGNNLGLSGYQKMIATHNPDLTCIYVDNAADASTETGDYYDWQIDTTAHYVETVATCNSLTTTEETFVPDDNFENYLETHDANGNTVSVGDTASLGNGIANDDYASTSKIKVVTNLDISGLSISDLTGITDFTTLSQLNCSGNTLSTLDVSYNYNLSELDCSQNQITSLDISNNTSLSKLYCQNNQLTQLSIDQNELIAVLWCDYNNLTNLHIQNSANGLLAGTFSIGSSTYSRMIATNNTNLSCIYVDDAGAAAAGTGDYQNWLTDATTGFAKTLTDCFPNADTTYIPDDNFEKYLETHTASGKVVEIGDPNSMGNGIDNDNYVFTDNINTVKNLNIYGRLISNITGISSFTALEYLRCGANYFTSLDLSQNTELKELDCTNASNNFTYLNISQNTKLKKLYSLNNPGLNSIDVTNNTLLHYLNIAGCNHISSLDLSQNPDLKYLRIDSCNFYNLDVSHNTALTSLLCRNNHLSHLDVSSNTALRILSCGSNNLSDLDISLNTDLLNLTCNNNNIAGLDLTNNTQLTGLNCSNNSLTNLDLSQNTALNELYCNDNLLTSLDVDSQPQLNKLWCYNNQLTELHIQNGANGLLSGQFMMFYSTFQARMKASNNPDLTCIFVEDATAATAGTGDYQDWEVDATAHYVETTAACNALTQTYVPDDNFEAYLEANGMGNGVDNDNYVFTENIENVTSLYIGGQNISDLTGIEDFTALGILHCYSNNLSSIDISHNTALIELYCNNNLLNTLDVSYNTALIKLGCNNNNISSLNVDANTALTNLYCNDNSISNLNLTQNTSLIKLDCKNNNLTTLVVSQCTNLTELFCNNNSIISLELDSNTQLGKLWCQDNQLTELHIQNGNNYLLAGTFTDWTSTTYSKMRAGNNTNLNCIYVDNKDDATAGTGDYQDWEVDATSHFVETTAQCNNYLSTTYVPDDNFEHYLETHNANGNAVSVGDPNSMGNGTDNDDYVTTVHISGVTHLYIYNKQISDLTGIEDFTSLSVLYCFNNNLTGLDLSQNTALTDVICHTNSLNTINCTQNTALAVLDCSGNNLTSLDLTQNTALTSLYCNDNNLSNLNLDTNPHIEKLWCHNNNQLSELHIQNGANNLLAGTFLLGGNPYPRMKANNNPNLHCIYVEDATAATSGTGDYQDWDVDATSHFVETTAECDVILDVADANIIDFALFPNPVSEQFTIEAGNNTIQQVNLYDMSGKLIRTYTPQAQYDVNDIASGMYSIKIITNNGYGIKKLVID